jgi:hypothetical protein
MANGSGPEGAGNQSHILGRSAVACCCSVEFDTLMLKLILLRV